VLNSTYDVWYSVDGGANSSVYNDDNLSVILGPLTESTHTVVVYVNDSGFIDNASVSFVIDTPNPVVTLVVDVGDPPYTADSMVDLGVYGADVYDYRFSCNATDWSGWILSGGSNPDWYNNFNLTNTSVGCNNSVGTRIVYTQARNYYNETSNIANDTIFWDITRWAASPFYDNFLGTQYVNQSTQIMYNVTASGGIRLNASCQNYTFEAGCWIYRKRIGVTETGGTDRQDYTFDYNFDSRTMVSQGKLQGDCDDIRVTYVNQTSGAEQLVDYWDEEGYCNSSKTRIWIEAPYLNASGTQYFYIYYGNSQAASGVMREGDNVFQFFDDFNDGALNATKWTPETAGYNFPVGAGYVEYWNPGGNDPSFYSNSNYPDGTIYWRFLTTDTSGDFDGSIVVRENDLGDNLPDGYAFMLDSRDAPNNGIQEAAFSSLAAFPNFVPQDLWIRSKAVFTGPSLSFYNDYHKITLTATDGTHTTGRIETWCDSDNGGGDRAGLDWIIYLNRTSDGYTVDEEEEEVKFDDFGNITSFLIKPAGIDTWEYLTLTHSIPFNTNITYFVYTENMTKLCEFETGEPITVYDISGCAYGHTRLRVHAELETYNNSLSPIIYNWQVSWLVDSDVVIDEPDDIYQDRFTSFLMNGSVYSDTDGCDVNVSGQYKLVGQSGSFIDDTYAEFSTYEEQTNISITDILTLLPTTSTQTWYDQDWPFRKKFNVSISEVQTNYPVEVVFTSADLDFSQTNNFQNIRITMYNESNGRETLLSHWVQDHSGAQAIVWIKIPEFTAGQNEMLFIYFGNSDAIDSQDGDSVFLFFDDFPGTTLDTSKWVDNQGTTAVANSNFSCLTGGDQECIYTKENTVSANTTVEFRMMAGGDNPGDFDSGVGVGSYNFLDDDIDGGVGQLCIDRNRWWNDDADGPSRVVDDFTTPHNFRINIRDAYVEFYDDTEPRLHNRTGTTVGPLYMLQDGDGAPNPARDTYWDWIFARPYGSNGSVTMLERENTSFRQTGNYTSTSFDTGASTVFWGDLTIGDYLPGGAAYDIYTRTSDDDSYWTSWELQTDGSAITSDGKRYIQYRLELSTSVSNATPEISSVTIDYITASPTYTDMSASDTTFETTNPYACGVMNEGDTCYPFWNTVTPKVRGKFYLRMHAYDAVCGLDEYSNEKLIYVFADSQITGFDSDTDPAARSETIVLSGTLSDDLLNPLDSKTIRFYEGTEYLGSSTTNSAGSFSFSYTIPGSASIGIHTYTAAFKKDYEYYYLPSSSTTNVKVSSSPVISNITITPDPAGVFEPVWINASITDEVGLSDVYVLITVPGSGTPETHSMVDDGTGNYSVQFTNTWEIGTYQITLVANNTDGIESQAYDTFTVSIEASPSLDINKDEYVNFENVLLEGTFSNPAVANWSFRTPIIMDTVENMTNYSLILSLTSSNFQDWNRTDGSDLKFMWYNGSELQCEHWVESWDSSGETASVYVKLPRLENNTIVYMYFGNPLVNSTGNRSAVFLWYDDFTTDRSAEYTEVNLNGAGAMYAWNTTAPSLDGDNSNAQFCAYPIGVNASKLYAEITGFTPDNDGVGLMVRDGANYYIGYVTSDYPSGGAGTDGIYTETVGTDPVLAQATVNNYESQNLNHTIGLLYNGSVLEMFVDGSSEVNYTVALTPDSFGPASSWNNPGLRQYNFTVRKIAPDLQYSLNETDSVTRISNKGSTPINGYRWALVQRWTGSAWEDIYPAIINDIAFDNMQTGNPGEYLNFHTDWNSAPWNTDEEDPGWYRVKIALVKNTTTPQSDSAVMVDSNGRRLEAFHNFTIKESLLILSKLLHGHLSDHNLNEYETTDDIDWINISVMAIYNTALNANVTLTLLDEIGLDYAGFGPDNETKSYGQIVIDTNETETWDNLTSGYYIHEDATSGTYNLNWNVEMVLTNGNLSVNDTEYILVHNLPSNFTSNSLERLYIDEYVFYNITISNQWSRNITNTSIKLNAPVLPGFNYTCNVSGLTGYTCYLGNVSAIDMAAFNLTANQSTPTGDYNINFTVNYTNPANSSKSWFEVKNAVLEIRERGLLEIFDYYHNFTIVRGDLAYFFEFANNTNGSVATNNTWLNYTVIPYNWSNVTGGLTSYSPVLNPDEVLWNNVTFLVGYSAGLGAQTITLNSSSDDIKPDFKNLLITVYANTSFSQLTVNDTNASRGETVLLTARLLWDNNSALVGETVYFYDQTDSKIIGSAVTNSTGHATKDYVLDSNTSLGLHVLNVTYEGRGAIYTLQSNLTTYLDVGLKPVINTITDTPDPVGYGMNLTISVNITDDDVIDQAKVYVTYPNTTQVILNLTDIGSDIYEAQFNDTWNNGTYDYFIWTNDTTESKQSSGTNTFDLEINATVNINTEESSYDQFENVTLTSPYSPGIWWDDSWTRRILIDFATNAIEEKYTQKIELNSSNFNFSAASTDGSDLRFTWLNTTSFTLLDHFVESWDNSSEQAIIWVEIPYMQDNISVHMYFDNDDAENISNATATWLWYDEFNTDTSASYTQTTLVNRGAVGDGGFNWNTVNSRVEGTQANDDDVMTVNGVSTPKVIVETRAYTEDDDAYGPTIPTTGGTYYHAVVSDNYPTVTDGVYSQVSGAGPVLVQGTFTPFPAQNNWHTIALAYNGSHFKVWIDDALEATTSVAVTPSGIGITSLANGNPNYFDYLKARKYTEEPISYSVGNAQRYGSLIVDTYDTAFRGHLVMQVQRLEGSTWVDVTTHINDSPSTFRYIPQGSLLNVSAIWNLLPWNTGNLVYGDYRVYAYMTTIYGEVLNTLVGPLEGTGNFSILPPANNVTIELIRIYEVNSTNKYGPATLLDSGLNKTFNLFINKSYRVEIETLNNLDSTDWNLSTILAEHSGLNSTWKMDDQVDIWYKIGTGTNQFNGTWNGSVAWNTTDIGGIAPNNTKVTFIYAVNITDNTTGDYPVRFEIIDPQFTIYDDSEFHVITETAIAPKLYNLTYNLTETDIIRTFNTSVIYGRWNDEIDEANALYNATIPGIISDSITLPVPNTYNWTNYTLNPSATWLLGKHVAKIEAKNPSDVWNNSLQYLNFTVFGLAYVKNFTLNTSTLDLGKSVSVKCSVEDDSDDAAIQGYNVSVTVDGAEVNWNLTNSSGWIEYSFTPVTYGIFSVACYISEQGYYKTDSRSTNGGSVFTKEFEPPRYYDISGPTLVHKANNITLSVRWEDNAALDNALLATNSSGWTNVSNISLTSNNSWANFSYFVPVSMTPGWLGWRQYGNDTSSNVNMTPVQTVEVWGWSTVESLDVDPASVALTNYTTATCRIIDSNNSLGIDSHNASYYRDTTYLGWNTTNSSGYATFSFNDSTIGVYNIYCNITDEPSIKYNASETDSQTDTLVVTTSPDLTAPILLSYGINDTDILRGQCIDIYGQWNEAINYSKAIYNYTTEFNETMMPLPYTSNWTNGSFCSNNNWSVGRHLVQLWANDTIGNINDTVPYLDFNMSGRSSVAWESPNGTMSRGIIQLVCNVSDYDTNGPVEDYRVLFYGPPAVGYLGNNFTNSTGQATFVEDASGYPTGNAQFQCQIASDPELYYVAVNTLDTETIYFAGGINTSISSPANNSILYRGRTYDLNSSTTFDNGTPITPDNAIWINSTLDTIATGENTVWAIPSNYPIGNETINVTAEYNPYENGTAQSVVEIWTYVELNQSYIIPNETALLQEFEFGCQVIDTNLSIALAGVNVTFYSDSNASLGWDYTNSLGWAKINHSYSNATQENVSCQVNVQQFYNVSSPYILNETITVYGTDIELVEIISPLNDTCGYDHTRITANVTNNGGAIQNVSVILYINGTLNESFQLNFSSLQSKQVNFATVLISEGRYNIMVAINHTDDGYTGNNNKTAVFDKYLTDLSLAADLAENNGEYNVSLNAINNKNCTINASVFMFHPQNMNLSYYSTMYNDTLWSAGRSYMWYSSIGALDNYTINTRLNGTLDYYVTDIIVGIDP